MSSSQAIRFLPHAGQGASEETESHSPGVQWVSIGPWPSARVRFPGVREKRVGRLGGICRLGERKARDHVEPGQIGIGSERTSEGGYSRTYSADAQGLRSEASPKKWEHLKPRLTAGEEWQCRDEASGEERLHTPCGHRCQQPPGQDQELPRQTVVAIGLHDATLLAGCRDAICAVRLEHSVSVMTCWRSWL